jgi:hypothetical protein
VRSSLPRRQPPSSPWEIDSPHALLLFYYSGRSPIKFVSAARSGIRRDPPLSALAARASVFDLAARFLPCVSYSPFSRLMLPSGTCLKGAPGASSQLPHEPSEQDHVGPAHAHWRSIAPFLLYFPFVCFVLLTCWSGTVSLSFALQVTRKKVRRPCFPSLAARLRSRHRLRCFLGASSCRPHFIS